MFYSWLYEWTTTVIVEDTSVVWDHWLQDECGLPPTPPLQSIKCWWYALWKWVYDSDGFNGTFREEYGVREDLVGVEEDVSGHDTPQDCPQENQKLIMKTQEC